MSDSARIAGSKHVRDMTDDEMHEAVRTGRKPFNDWARQVDSVNLGRDDWKEAAHRLLADVERLRGLSKTLMARATGFGGMYIRQLERADKLEEEVQRLRKTLHAIAEYEPGSVYIGEYAVTLKQYARDALAEEERRP